MKKLFYILLVLICSYKLHAQQFIERVYLKDSSFYEGYIIEQVPTQYLKIDRIKQKDTVTVPLNLVWKITKTYLHPKSSSTKKTEKAKNGYLKTAFMEAFGNAGLYSINFDMRTERGRRDRWGFRVGFEYLSVRSSTTTTGDTSRLHLTAFPFGVNYLIGKRKGFLELGVGATYFFLNAATIVGSGNVEDYQTLGINISANSLAGTFNIGYRHVPYENGITYRFCLTPLFIDGALIPFWGTSVGYKF